MLETILIVGVSSFVFTGFSYLRCKKVNQVNDKYRSVVFANIEKTQEYFDNKDYDKVRELIQERRQITSDAERECELYWSSLFIDLRMSEAIEKSLLLEELLEKHL